MKSRPATSGNWRAWLPTRGNVIFTLLIAFGLLAYGRSVGAFPASAPPHAPIVASTNTIPYQGRLADANGAPVNGMVAMTFKLYDDAVFGNELWSEYWSAVQVNGGLFNVLLGSTFAITQSVFSENDSLWLGVTVGNDSEMTPRVQLGSVPFALQALTMKQENLLANDQFAQGDTEGTANADNFGDLLSITVTPTQPATLRISFHAVIWKTLGGGRTALGIRVDGSPNVNFDGTTHVQAGTSISSNWATDSTSLANTCFVDVPAGMHTINLVLASYDAGTSHARAYALTVETLKKP